jgi:hypothetical protein
MPARREPFRDRQAEALIWAPIADELLAGLILALESGELVPELGARELRRGPRRRVWRVGEHVVKLYLDVGLRDHFRAAHAVRAARAHARLLPVQSPAPRCAVWERRRGLLRASALVYDWIEGPDLAAVWPRDAAARAALPELMASLHERRIYHGDLHARHLIWSAGELFVIDLDSLRHPGRTLWPSALARREWARLARELGDGPELRAAFVSYLAARGLRSDPEHTWSRVLELLTARELDR